jgi:MFS family permease
MSPHPTSQGRLAPGVGFLAILSATLGILNAQMFCVGFLAPFFSSELHVDNARLGFMVAGFWLPYAVSSYFAAKLADRYQKRKTVLIVALPLLSIATAASGAATSFEWLLGARILAGLCAGPVMPLAQSLVAIESPANRIGFNMGVVQSVGSGIVFIVMGPALFVYVSEHVGWRAAFYLLAIPGTICAALVGWLVAEPRAANKGIEESGGHLADMFGSLTFIACLLNSTFLMAYINLTVTFLPQVLIQSQRLSGAAVGGILTMIGAAAATLGVLLPGLSDRIGRKPVLITACGLGALTPLSALFLPLGPVTQSIMLFVSWSAVAVAPLVFATIPAGVVPQRSVSAAIGLNMAQANLLGGVLSPILAGAAAETWGLRAPMFILVVLAAGAALVSLLMRETQQATGRAGLMSGPRAKAAMR